MSVTLDRGRVPFWETSYWLLATGF